MKKKPKQVTISKGKTLESLAVTLSFSVSFPILLLPVEKEEEKWKLWFCFPIK